MGNWFDVDKAGLAKLMAGRPKAFVLFELLQNAWDQSVTQVDVTLEPVPGTRNAEITVIDDDPDGFADLRDAYTLFADSRKKGNPAQRGRFNLGEKLVLALARSARIESTTGTVEFTEAGGRVVRRHRRPKGSMFQATIPMTRAEIEEATDAARRLIVPAAIVTTINGVRLADRPPIAGFEETLPTVIADDQGVLRKTNRKTRIWVYEPRPGETATLYELGIPVVETGDRYHVDVEQKVPLNMDRDNVPPSYLRTIRVSVLNATYGRLEQQDAARPWVRDACSDERVGEDALRRAMTLRFGERAVRYDPSDPEANKRSAAEGRTVVPGGTLSAEEWANVRRAGVLPPAGRVTPSPKPYSEDGQPLQGLPESQRTPGMRRIADYAQVVARELLGCEIAVVLARECSWPYRATYGNGRLVLNVAKCGHAFFDHGITDAVNDLLLHEFGHHYASDHLSDEYHRALTALGARMVRLALDRPGLFR